MKDRFLTLLGPLLGATLFALALWILHRHLEEVGLRDLIEHWQAVPLGSLALALALTALSYAALTGYDALAFRFIRQPLGYARIAFTSFIAYVFSHNVGLSFFGGSAVRYRLFMAWGVPAGAIGQVILFDLATFWLGFLAAGGCALALAPLALPGSAWIPVASSRPLGCALLGLLGLCGIASARSLRVPWLGIALPRPPMLAAQVLLSSIDWLLAASVLYVLLPPSAALAFPHFFAAYVLAVTLGLASHVPAGLGVFETSMVVLLSSQVPAGALLASMLAYRLVYYAIPLALAFLLFASFEARAHRPAIARAHAWLGAWLPVVVPRIFAFTTLAAGTLLLFSGATPPATGRMEGLLRFLPLPVLETSHLLGSAIGVALLFLARALLLRMDAAYLLTLALLASGVAASLLKGLDYEEASILGAMFIALLPCRSYFDRRSSLVRQPLSPAWSLGVLCVLATTAFVTALAYRDVTYSNELWWQFAASADASRSLRALFGAVGFMGCLGLARLLGPVPPDTAAPSAEQVEAIRPVVAASPRSYAHLALLGDKRLLMHERGSAFLMYGVERNTWVSMGDPVGAPAERRELAWRFRELADQHRGRTVFYEVAAEDLPVYVDLGLSLHKLGEEARVPLAGFSLAGGERRSLRQTRNRMLREGCVFEILPPHEVPPILDELEAISDAWLAEKKTGEKRFSLGFFDRAYLARLPVAVVRHKGQIAAFANVWTSDTRTELSVDLMRHRTGSPSGVMDYLFCELMLWGSEQGYAWFNMGMAPLAGLPEGRLAPLWSRFGGFLFRHAEPFYGFHGLREFKEKFAPVWEPRFLASPGGLAVPVALAHVATLISGGVGRVLTK